MKESKTAVLVRLGSTLKRQLVELARREHRSLNQQIEFLLEQALLAQKHPSGEVERTDTCSD